MNTILQKRIKEAAYEESSTYDLTEIKESNAAYNAAIKVATFILQNQWISVEEALPTKESDDSSITVLVKCKRGWCGIDYYRYNYGEWLNNGDSVTHWMSIPDLKGGEK